MSNSANMVLLGLIVAFVPLSASQNNYRKIMTSDSVQLFVTVRGQGSPCLYIHGGPGSGSHWIEKFSGEMLEGKFTMIYLDQRGVGRSTSPADGNYSLDRRVADYEEVRAALGIEHWLIMGHSFAGMLMTGYAQRNPEALDGMLMINCTLNLEASMFNNYIPKAYELLGVSDPPEIPDSRDELFSMMNECISRLRKMDSFWRLGYSSRQSMEQIDASYADIPEWNGDLSDSPIGDEFWADFSRLTVDITQPVLFFYGSRDWMAGPDSYKYAHFPNMLLWRSETSHMPFLDNPEDLERAIESYRKAYGF